MLMIIKKRAAMPKIALRETGRSTRPSNWLASMSGRLEESRKISSGAMSRVLEGRRKGRNMGALYQKLLPDRLHHPHNKNRADGENRHGAERRPEEIDEESEKERIPCAGERCERDDRERRRPGIQ